MSLTCGASKEDDLQVLGGHSVGELKNTVPMTVATRPAKTPVTLPRARRLPPLPLSDLCADGANQMISSVMTTFCAERNRFSPYVEKGKAFRYA